MCMFVLLRTHDFIFGPRYILVVPVHKLKYKYHDWQFNPYLHTHNCRNK